MCDSATADLIRGVVKDLTDENLMFSAYDITKILRDRGHSVSHRDVRSEVHSMLGNDEIPRYVKLMHSFEDRDGNTISAFVFMPDGNFVGDYDAKALPDSLQNAPKTNQNATTRVGGKKVARIPFGPLDSRGRLWVPKAALFQLGAVPGDKVFVLVGNGRISITQAKKQNAVPYHVDKDGLIAISNCYLLASGLDRCSYFSFRIDNVNALVVEGV
jgi:hypothetical protein